VPTQPVSYHAYGRVSTHEQALSGLGIEAQTERMRAYVFAHGATLAQLQVDAGLSGTLPPAKRPGLTALLQRLERAPRGQAAVLVYRLDRLGRSAREVLNLEHELRRRRIGLVSVSESFDSSTPSGRAYLALLATFSEYEAALAAERTFAAMRGALSPLGARVGGVAPIGYNANAAGTYEVVPREAATVRRLFALFAETRSFASTGARLNDACLPTRDSHRWSHATVGNVVRNVETYAGCRLWGRTSRKNGSRDQGDWLRVPGAHEPILDAATVEQVQAILDRRDRRRAARHAATLEQEENLGPTIIT